ncbi:hypothetical protein EYF80_055099 [Liparis tanakae]|uniref:Uncharacterized protein n=1 Tax=Liparis tanakae TaxID=230148 RepID=A0A4Z2F2L5_9TELE|nr:hypothetical protein EYF80_055099 [Liparis tanakae]
MERKGNVALTNSGTLFTGTSANTRAPRLDSSLRLRGPALSRQHDPRGRPPEPGGPRALLRVFTDS